MGSSVQRAPRFVAVLVAVLLAFLMLSVDEACAAFDLDDVGERAKKLAAATYNEPKGQVPDWLLKLSYDQWRDIRFRPDEALWRAKKLPFQVQFFHPGLFYDRTVRMNVVEPTGVKPVRFSPNQFDYGKNDFASRVPQDLGYAGFRVHARIKTKDYFDEVIVFLGATYFRAVGRDEVFGLSARGLAVDTAESRGEEFPWFREFWLVQPAPGAKELVLYALLDSPSLTGAYRFAVNPGDQTVVKVEGRLFLRREVQKLGIAPLTSMFFHGENTRQHFDDFRPEVHDTDGLLVHFASGEWLWRPVDNPSSLNVSGLQTENPKGFGLLQRDRNFDHYQDLETQQHHRPSVWIAPDGNWSAGRIELVEIPTNADTNDNVVAYWVPKQAAKVGEPFAFGFTMHWYGEDASRPPGGRTFSTRRDAGTIEGAQRIVVDFSGGKLQKIPAERVLRGVVTVVGGADVAELLDQHVVKNPEIGGWRLSFHIRPKTRQAVELRAFLEEGGEVLTETWSYQILP